MSKLSRYNLLTSLVRHELTCKHVQAIDPVGEKHNALLYQKGIEAWIFLSDDLMCRRSLTEQARNTRLRNLIQLLNNEPIINVLNTLKEIYDVLIRHISGKYVLSSYIDFKGQLEEKMHPLLGFLLSPIKESLHSVITSQTVVSRDCYRSEATRDMWVCAHYLQFLVKTNFVSSTLETRALQDYLAFEDETASYSIGPAQPYIPALQKILKDWMKDWSYDGLSSKHGPGSVADSSRFKYDKYLALAADDKTKYLTKSFELRALTFANNFERCSKLVFVPKNITKLRSISMEPATLQFLQQGCMRSLYNYFRSHKSLKRILKLEDQEQNKSLAYHASITNDYATLDLSHASDSLNWDLTKILFKRCPELVRWLVCTRSTHTLLPTGEKLLLKKFAPMGSALCFPIESLVFAAIAKLAIQLSKEEALDRDNETGIRSGLYNFSVYGDDIIVPTYAAEYCAKLLKIFGFTINEEKSYFDGPFKESCGGNYYCGFDITAIKFAPEFDESYANGISPSSYAALCSYANLAYERGLSMFRLWCIKSILEAGLKPYFSDRLDTSPAIFSPNPTNFHLKEVYSKRYQKYQLLYTGLKTVEKGCPEVHTDDEEVFLTDYLLNKFITREGEATSLHWINAKISDGLLSFDVTAPYSRKQLLPNVLKYALCKMDVFPTP